MLDTLERWDWEAKVSAPQVVKAGTAILVLLQGDLGGN